MKTLDAHFILTVDVPNIDIYADGEVSTCSALSGGKHLEVDVYYVGDEFILAKDDISHMAIPKRKLLDSIKNRKYWEEKMREFNELNN